MAKKKRGNAHTGGHGWFVTFADLMGLMMSFFVMLVAFSSMDNNNLEIVDQDGRSMFADGSKVPYERTRRLIQKLAAPLKATPLRVSIIGHTAAGFVPARSDYDAFDLSADRANAVRQILEREGPPLAHIFAVSGKADGQPLFPDDPSLAANRRVTIILMREDPPLPPGLKP